MRALRRFTVRAHLPSRLRALEQLAQNLRWSWDLRTQEVFATVDPGRWQATRDPVRLLSEISPARLDELAGDESFLRKLDGAASELTSYLTGPRWYQNDSSLPTSIAYFSMEFGITEVLPNYSGGLGILAGDHLKAASDLGVPLIGVGLLYRSGYFQQALTADGWQAEHYPSLDPQGLPLRLLNNGGAPILIHLAMPDGRVLRAQVWIAQVGRVPLLLLDSDVAENDGDLRRVTDRLYGGGQDQRIEQEILAGIGGVRAVRAYTSICGVASPEVFHMNEGHAGFLGLERIREYVAQGHDFAAALEAVRAGTVFTTHTPVPAGIDRFPMDLVRRYLGGEPGPAVLPGLRTSQIMALGRESDPGTFNMAYLALRLAQRANGVSRLHGEVSREMFAPLWPGFDVTETPIGHIMNGVHADTWTAPEWRAHPSAMDLPQLWETRNALRTKLVDEIRARVRRSWRQRGAGSAELGWTETVFDPMILTIGFARRVPAYKRLTLMLHDPQRLRALLLDPARPVQLVVAGKSHPADDEGKALIQQLVRFADQEDVRHRMVFLPDYDMSMARYLYWGCDVWLNNPLRPLEACGTSGMKAVLNGGLNVSIRDGWWDECFDGENGWAIPSASEADPARRDELEATALYEVLETSVRQRFYHRDAQGIPQRWTEMIQHAQRELSPKVLASRMVADYIRQLYFPAAQSSRAALADNLAGARELAHYRLRAEKAWPEVKIQQVDTADLPAVPEVGASLTVRAQITLGGLEPGEVRVQAVIGRAGPNDELTDIVTVDMRNCGTHSGAELFEATTSFPMAGPTGLTVRVLPSHPGLAAPVELGLVVVAG